MRRLISAAALSLAALLATARASPHTASAEPEREPHGGLGAGGFVAVLGPFSSGLAVSAAISPGGALGRFGGRVSGRTLDDDLADGLDGGMLLGGVVYEAAAARPRLAISLHGDAGPAVLPGGPHLALGGGVETTLWIVGPLAVALDSTAHVVLRGVDSELLVAGALTVNLAR